MKAILVDVTRCRGCMKCVEACRKQNGSPPDSCRTLLRKDLSADRLTTVDRTASGRYVKRQCNHCQSPSCVSACLVGAIHKEEDGPVVYDATKCIGCRYCMLACPFEVPRYEWGTTTPRMRKCEMCHDRPGGPACVEACPNHATLYGERDELLEIARERIAAAPDRYLDHVWGEHDAGGTSVLYLSDVPLDEFWPSDLGARSVPDLTWPVVSRTPWIALSVAGTLTVFSWLIDRRNRLAAPGGEVKP
jgi:formate dehydrogenase iron-sulfur subunit